MQHLTPSTAPSPEILTKREYKVLQLIVTGKRNKDIGKALEVSVRTVETFRAHINKKLKLRTSAELVIYALRFGIIDKDGQPTAQMQLWQAL